MPIAFDIIHRLDELRWRGISAPASSIETAFDQSTVEHLRPGEDDGLLEATGRTPIQVSATLHFRNALFASQGDSWKSNGPLYPKQYLEFVDACADSSTGILNHPTLGPMTAKIISFRSNLSADKRDGEDVQVVWKKTLELDLEIFGRSSISDALSAAAALDEIIFILPLEIQASDPDNFVESFLSAVSKATKAVDKATLAARKIGGVADRVLYRCEALYDACERVKSPQMWPAKNTINRLMEAMRQLQREKLKKAKPTSIYINPKPQTVPSLSVFLDNKVGDILEMNPSLMGVDLVAPKVPVRFYSKTSAT